MKNILGHVWSFFLVLLFSFVIVFIFSYLLQFRLKKKLFRNLLPWFVIFLTLLVFLSLWWLGYDSSRDPKKLELGILFYPTFLMLFAGTCLLFLFWRQQDNKENSRLNKMVFAMFLSFQFIVFLILLIFMLETVRWKISRKSFG